MIKPSSSLCNLKCEYCFYSSLASERGEYSKGFMRLKTAENIVKSAVEFTKGTRIIFTFQGGEPLLSGIGFYREFVELVKKHNSYHSQITYCLQTNATLINEEWCAFFKDIFSWAYRLTAMKIRMRTVFIRMVSHRIMMF